MITPRPGMNDRRLVRLICEAVDRCRLELRDRVVFTEAATGAYVVTPVLAALAGAHRVYGMTRSTSYGTVEEVTEWTQRLARRVGVETRIQIVTEKRPEWIVEADVVTNSGHARPLDRETVGWMKSGSVIPLMYEAWELRSGEVDLEACRQRGVRVAGTNERHPDVDVFSYLGQMAVKLLLDAGVAVYRSNVLVVCDNPFAPFIRNGLAAAGARVEMVESFPQATSGEETDAILIALKPSNHLALGAVEAASIASRWPGAVVAQFWGDIDRSALADLGVPYWPLTAPGAGHMGILPSAVGPEPIVRLQAGGLKVAEVLLSGAKAENGVEGEYIDVI
jgi:hypothetical protein